MVIQISVKKLRTDSRYFDTAKAVIKVLITQQSDTTKCTGCEELRNILRQISFRFLTCNTSPVHAHQYVPTSYRENDYQLRFISSGYCDGIYQKGQNTSINKCSRLLRCLHRW